MSLPYKRIPAGIAAFTSPTGFIPAAQLRTVPGSGQFQIQAARALRALGSAASASGLTIASVGDYRSYAEQVTLFLSRYTTTPHPGQRTEVFMGRTYWLKPGAAGAANPGSSNHGLGLANDFALLVNGQVVTLDTDVFGTSLWDWLNAHGRTYGWSWGEAFSERWHWVYIEGDVIPAAVLQFEATVKVIDYFAPWPGWDPRALKAAGITGVSRYISGDFTSSKEISKAEYDACRAAGLTVTLNWETTGHAYTGGRPTGLIHGAKARAQVRSLGHPDSRHIFQSEADVDIPVAGYPKLAEYQGGFNDGGGCGIQSAYSTAGAIDYLFARKLIKPGWQSASRGYVNNGFDSGTASMIQRLSKSFPQFNPVLYDENDIRKADWGQVPAPPGVDDMSAADVTAINAHTDAKIDEVTTFLTKMLRGDGVGTDTHDNESVEGAVTNAKAATAAANSLAPKLTAIQADVDALQAAIASLPGGTAPPADVDAILEGVKLLLNRTALGVID